MERNHLNTVELMEKGEGTIQYTDANTFNPENALNCPIPSFDTTFVCILL